MPDLDSTASLDPGKCPKCGYTRDPGWSECPACGVIFARLRPATSELPPPPPTDDGLYNPYQAPQADLYEPASLAEDSSFELADPGSRLLSELINGFSFVGLMIVGFIPIFTLNQGEVAGCSSFFLPLVLLMAWISWNWSWISKYDQSVGKRVMKLRVVQTNGERISMGRHIALRWLVGKFLLRVVPFYELVDALFIFRDDRRCVHDHVADTIVVKAPPNWQGEPR